MESRRDSVVRRLIVAAATWSARHPWPVLLVALVLTIGCAHHVATHFRMNTDSADLIAANVPWKERSAAFDQAFPQRTDVIAIVVDGDTPEIAEHATASLAAALAKRTDLLKTVRRPDGGPFFERNGLLFLDAAEVTSTLDQLVGAQAALGTLAADPSVRGLMTTLSLALQGVEHGEITLATLQPGLVALDGTLKSVIDGHPKALSWRSMLGGRPADPRELRRFVLVQPVLDYSALKPGEKASDFIRATAADLKLDAAHGVRVRLTGNVPMADEEFGTLEEHAGLNAAAMTIALLVMLWFAVRSARAIVAIVACVIAGLAITAALGSVIYGSFNLISVAFAVLFIGLGVDFGIQYGVAWRAVAGGIPPVEAARRAALHVGTSLALAAVGIAAGFFAFEPTDYRGVSELGVIAGFGMLIAFVANVTLLPALLRLMQVGGRPDGMGFARLAPLDAALARHRRTVLVVSAVVGLVSLALLPFVRFDFNPLHLRSPKTEAVATLLDLSKDPQTTPDTVNVVAPSLDAAVPLAAKLSALPEVSMALTLDSFVPKDQEPKLAAIADAATLLDPTINPGTVEPAPSDADNARALREAAMALRNAVTKDPSSPAAADATKVAQSLETLANGPPGQRRVLDDVLLPGLQTLAQVRSMLLAGPVTRASLPPELKADWVAADGRARIEVFPKAVTEGTGKSAFEADEAITRFLAAVRAVAPDATGAPISIQESAHTILRAFEEAGLWALIAVTILLVIVLRRAREVLFTLASLVLGGLVTLGLCVVLGIPLNYANIIALPLLFGIGVAFNIYFVIAWRHGIHHLLQTSLARAVLFSALATSTAFGSLWMSSHPGTASMGKLLALSLACTLAAAMLVLPALLGPPPNDRPADAPS